MATSKQIKTAAQYYIMHPTWDFNIGSIWGSGKKSETQTPKDKYYASLSTSEKKVFKKESEKFLAIQKDLMERQVRTEKRKRLQQNVLKLGTSLAVAAVALPVLSGILNPATPIVAIADIPAGATAVEAGLPASTITGAISSSGGGILATIGKVGKVVTGGIETLADILPKAGALYGAVESLLGREDQPVTTVAKNPSSPAPASSQPVINVMVPETGTGQQTGTSQPVFFQTPAAETNYMLYAGIAILAIILLKGH